MQFKTRKYRIKHLLEVLDKFTFNAQSCTPTHMVDKEDLMMYILKVKYQDYSMQTEHEEEVFLSPSNPYAMELVNKANPYDITSANYLSEIVRKVLQYEWELLALEEI